MQIRQLQVACDHAQDRLVLRVSSPDNEEYRVWLTRRFLRELWPHLVGLMGKNAPLIDIVEDAVPAEAGNFEETFSDENASYPLGSTPLLTTEVKFDTLSDGTFKLTFREGRERSFPLALNADMLHTLCVMLRAGAEHAQWDLALADAADTAIAAPRNEHLSRLH